jgi:DNA-binding response OmpR family regulator
MTARAQASDTAAYRDAGALDVITKPFDPMTLPDQIRTIWGQR